METKSLYPPSGFLTLYTLNRRCSGSRASLIVFCEYSTISLTGTDSCKVSLIRPSFAIFAKECRPDVQNQRFSISVNVACWHEEINFVTLECTSDTLVVSTGNTKETKSS